MGRSKVISQNYKGVLPLDAVLRYTKSELRNAIEDGWLPPIGGAALESNIYGLWCAKQSGRGSPATMTAGTKKLRWVGGDLQIARADGSEPYSDGTLFGDTVDFVNTLTGNGAPVIQAQSSIMAYLSWLACGQETVTGGTNEVHSFAVSGAPAGGQAVVNFYGFQFVVPWNMTAAAFQAAMLAAINSQGVTLPAGSVVVTGGPLPGAALTISFGGALNNQPVPIASWSQADAFTGGATPASAVTETTPGTPYRHVITPNDVGGFWSTWVKSVGKSVIHRAQFNDGRISTLRWEGSSASKVLKVTPTMIFLDPGQFLTADPTKTDDGLKPLLYTEAQGTFTIDGEVYRGHSAFAAEAQWALTEWYGDAPTAFDMVNGRATLVLQGITIILDDQGLKRFNSQIYGTKTPTAGMKPLQTIPALGSYSCAFSRVNPYTGGISEAATFSIPSVKWDPNLAIPANPAGGPVELPLAAEFRKKVGSPAFQVTVDTPNDVAFTS